MRPSLDKRGKWDKRDKWGMWGIWGASDARAASRYVTRAALRGFFEVDHRHIALAALSQLRGQAGIDANTCNEALKRFGLNADALAPWEV